MIEILRSSYHSSQKGLLWCLIVTMVAIISVEITATVLVPQWRGYFFDGVQAKDYTIYIKGLWYFGAISVAFILSQGFKAFLIDRLALVWRDALTKVLTERWNTKGNTSVDNPDQRISEDTNIAANLALELLVEVIISAAIILGLIGGMSATLLWMSALYTIGITVMVMFFHRPLINREKELRRSEADFRYALAHKNTGQFTDLYGRVRVKYMKLMNITLGFNLFSRTKGAILSIAPLIVLVPAYFAGDINFGDIMKGSSQFDLMVVNATILIVLYPKVTKALASYERIKEFYHA